MSQHTGETSEDIGGFRYRVMMLDPLTAADVIADLGYILAPVMGSVSGAFAKGKGDLLQKAMDGFDEGEETDIDQAIERAILGFFDRISKEKQRELMVMMSKLTYVQMGEKEPQLSSIFDAHFRGRIASMYKWFMFAMKVQFKDFFSGLGDGTNLAQSLIGKLNKAP